MNDEKHNVSKKSRKPHPKTVQVFALRRDLWLCRWCKRPVVFAPAMKYLQEELEKSGYGGLAYWRYAYDRHGAPLLDELAAVLDHAQPFSMGGTEETENLATACNRCNMQKEQL